MTTGISADDDGFVRLHDLETGDVSSAIGPRVAEHDLDVSPDGRWLVLGPSVWDLTTGSERFRFAEPPPENDQTAWSADSRLLAIVSGVEGNAVEVLDLDGTVQAVLSERDGYGTSSVSYSPDGLRLVTIGTGSSDRQPETGRITVWDWRQGTVIKDIETPPTQLEEPPAQFVTVDPSGRYAATGFGPPAIWDLNDGTHREIEGIDSTAEVAFSPDGSLLAVPVGATVRLYDTAAGQLRLALGGGRGPIGRVAFSGDGSMLAAHGVDEAYVWTLDLDRLIAVGRQELTRDWTDEECRRFLHQERCAP
jgi:WD40 repeat protein